jgi:hypothetical protein
VTCITLSGAGLSEHRTLDGWHGFNFNVEEWDAEGLHYETLAICRSLELWA